MVAETNGILLIGGVEIREDAVTLVRRGYASIEERLKHLRKWPRRRPSLSISEVIHEDGPRALPPLLADADRRRFEELTGAYLPDISLELIWLILQNDLHVETLGPTHFLVRPDDAVVNGGAHLHLEVRLVPWR